MARVEPAPGQRWRVFPPQRTWSILAVGRSPERDEDLFKIRERLFCGRQREFVITRSRLLKWIKDNNAKKVI